MGFTREQILGLYPEIFERFGFETGAAPAQEIPTPVALEPLPQEARVERPRT
jgi:hypothetical protein